jgi:hypothetical protein
MAHDENMNEPTQDPATDDVRQTAPEEMTAELKDSLNSLSDLLGHESQTDADDEMPESEDDNRIDVKSDPSKDDGTPKVDDSLLERAVKAGFTLADARAFSSGKDLEKAVAALEAAKRTDAGNLTPAKETSAAKESEKLMFDDLLEEGFDPRMIERLNKIGSRLEQLEAENLQLRQTAGSDRAFEDFDRRIGALGDEFFGIFGTGQTLSLDQSGAEFKQRAAVISEMAAMREGYRATGKQAPPIETLFARAVYNVTGQTVTARSNTDVAAALRKRAGASIGLPGGGNQKPATKAAVAKQSVRELSRILAE